MDKFITRTRLPARDAAPRARAEPRRVQTKISALAGVVSLEGVRSLAASLSDASATPEQQLLLLAEADAMRIALEILEATTIGRAVGHLARRSLDARVRDRALGIETRWREKATEGLNTRKRRVAKGMAEVVPAAGAPPPRAPRAAREAQQGQQIAWQEVEELEAAAASGEATRLEAGRKRSREEGGSGGAGGASAGAAAAAASAAAGAGAGASSRGGGGRDAPGAAHLVPLVLNPVGPMASPRGAAFKPALKLQAL